jgi:hypothetical protein
MIKYVYEIDYPLGEKRKYLEWVRSIADTLQAPGELKRLASYDNAFSASPHRVIEFTFESMADAGKYFDRKEMVRIFQGELPAHGENIHIKVLTLRGDYTKDLGTRRRTAERKETADFQLTADDATLDQIEATTATHRDVTDETRAATWTGPLDPGERESARFEPDASQ